MTATPNLALDHIAAGQNSKEVTANAAFDGLDKALTDELAVDVSAGNETITDTQIREAIRLAISGASVAGRTVTVPAIKRLFVATLDAASTESVAIVRGTASFDVAPDEAGIFYTDGTANGLFAILASGATGVANFTDLGDVPASYTSQALKGVRVNAGATALEFFTRAFLGLADVPASFTGAAFATLRVNSAETAVEFLAAAYDLAVQVEAAPTASEIVARYVFPRAVRFPAGMTLSQAKSGVAATGTPSFDFKKNGGAAFATCAWTASGSTGSYTAASATDFAAGDVLTITAPGTPDATLAQIGFTLAGYRI